MATVIAKQHYRVAETPSSTSSLNEKEPNEVVNELPTVPQLGVPKEEKRFFFQRTKDFDPNAIATQPSVYDDPDTAKQYQPRSDWENLHRFDPSFRWTWSEEYKIIRKVDLRILIFACVMFMALELDRSNLLQAVSDNFLKDLRMTTNDYNLGNSVFKLAFLCAELPSQLVSKWIGPDRWIPAQMVLWSIVAVSQFHLSGKSSFLATRALLGVLQGGFIPDMILYLSYFYKHHELTIRLGFFWTALTLADIASALLAYGLLHMRGVQGKAGWRWLFLIEGLFTLVMGLVGFLLMPASPTQTASWFRGKKGWFTEKEEKIIVNRVIREDPSKATMHNRQPVTPKLLWQSLKDYDLWPLYLLGFTFQIPATPPTQYITLSLKGLGYTTFQTNLLSIPYNVFHIVNMLALVYAAEIVGELTFMSLIGQIWMLPFLIYLNVVNSQRVSRWIIWAVTSLLLSYPNAHPIQVAWNSRNSNTVRSRTVSAATYNMFCQAGGITASYIYRADDAPLYKRGNKQLLAILCANVVLYLLVKAYYVLRNKRRDTKWDALTEEQRIEYLATTTDKGNKRLDFRFAH